MRTNQYLICFPNSRNKLINIIKRTSQLLIHNISRFQYPHWKVQNQVSKKGRQPRFGFPSRFLTAMRPQFRLHQPRLTIILNSIIIIKWQQPWQHQTESLVNSGRYGCNNGKALVGSLTLMLRWEQPLHSSLSQIRLCS
jgi:hypothetical protein